MCVVNAMNLMYKSENKFESGCGVFFDDDIPVAVKNFRCGT